LDTNAKKFKYSSFFKIICVILCAVTFFFACKTGILTVMSYVYEKEFASSTSGDWTASRAFEDRFATDASIAALNTTHEQDYDDAVKTLKANKDKIIDKAYAASQELKKQVIADYEHEAAETADYYEYDENGEPVGEPITTQTTALSEEALEQINKERATADYIDIEIGSYNYGTLEIHSDDTKETLAARYDSFIDEWASSFVAVFGNDSVSKEACWHSSLGKQVAGNVQDFNEKAVYDSDIYYVLKNGKAEYKGIDKETADCVTGRINGTTQNADKAAVYLYIPSVSALTKTGFNNVLHNDGCEYSLIKEFHGVAAKYYDDVAKYCAITLGLLALSFIFGIAYFTVTGKKNDEEPAKLFFYDYIPLEIGMCIAGGLGTGAGALAVWLVDDHTSLLSAFSVISAWLFTAFGCVCWLVLFMLTASTIRYARSDRKFYKHFITFWVLLGLWKVIVFCWGILVKIFKAIGRLIVKIFGKIKELFSALGYRPTKFKRNIIIIACLFIGGNALLLFIGGMLFAFGRAPFLNALIYLGVIAGDVYALYRVCNYIKNLDIIIDASSRHEDVMLDLEKLDGSLRILAESMRYTNAELQNAIAKAVKDERLRTELITNVSHDLKTPLTSIITYVDLLSKCDIKDEKAQEYIKVLDEKGNKLKRLIDDLIEASKVTSGNVTVNLAPMNLSELCLQATVDAQQDFEKAGLELVIKQGEKPVIVFADGTKTNRIIENLLSNARKYSAKASRVYVSVTEENGSGVFEIKNVSAQPLDITPEELTERFVRGDRSRSQEGNGLGLSIAQELAKLQNGVLELQIDGDLFKARVKLPKNQ
jgi:signal transduction histidine kinase